MLYGEVLAVEEFHPLGGKEVWTNRVRGWTYKVIEDLNRHSVGMKEVWYWWDVIEVDVLEMRIG